jgi:type II secretory pathway pseudopilin PulG
VRTSSYSSKQRGFTLFEIILSASILGLLTWVMAPSIRTLMTAKETANRDSQYVINQKIANAMLAWSEAGGTDPNTFETTKGTLPAPCTLGGSTKLFSGVPASSDCPNGNSLVQYMLQQGVPYPQLTTDGTSNANVRVYQRISDPSLYEKVGLMYPSGPQVTLNYQAGVVYSTMCGQKQACNTSLTSLIPLANTLTEVPDPGDAFGVRTMPDPTWKPRSAQTNPVVPADYAVAYVSTLPLQKKFLALTATQIDTIRTALKNYVATKQAAAPTSTANFYPQESATACSNGATACGSGFANQLSTPVAIGNQWCWDGWYSLYDSNSDILQQLGIGDYSLGQTAWGGGIEYCRDYDANGIKGKGASPHYGAIRLNSNVGLGAIPDTNTIEQNIIISF